MHRFLTEKMTNDKLRNLGFVINLDFVIWNLTLIGGCDGRKKKRNEVERCLACSLLGDYHA